MSDLTVSPEDGQVEVFDTLVSDIQSDVEVSGNKITGTLKYLDDGPIVAGWGAGNFIALKFSNIDKAAKSVKVGLDPSEGSGLVEIINDPDKNGVFKITDKSAQVFKVVSTDLSNRTTTQVFDLSELEVLEE